MSADNWRKCPKCLKLAKDLREQAIQRAQSRYGKIAEPAYRKLITKAESPIELKETLRENYCQRIDEDGEFQSSYYCYCERCGFEFQHKYGQGVDLE
jgi:hypothetical protein